MITGGAFDSIAFLFDIELLDRIQGVSYTCIITRSLTVYYLQTSHTAVTK